MLAGCRDTQATLSTCCYRADEPARGMSKREREERGQDSLTITMAWHIEISRKAAREKLRESFHLKRAFAEPLSVAGVVVMVSVSCGFQRLLAGRRRRLLFQTRSRQRTRPRALRGRRALEQPREGAEEAEPYYPRLQEGREK